MSKPFRAKFYVTEVKRHAGLEAQEVVSMAPITDSTSEENKSFSKYTPAGNLSLTITNPDLLGNVEPGEIVYIDFTPTGENRWPKAPEA